MAENSHVWLKVVERIVVIIAAGLAIWPLWEWYASWDDRNLERATNVVQTAIECERFWLEHQEREEKVRRLAEEHGEDFTNVDLWIQSQFEIHDVCRGITGSIRKGGRFEHLVPLHQNQT